MSLVTERRTSWELTGDPSVLRDPANLPYEAVRLAWWKGFQAAVAIALATVIAMLVAVVAILIVNNAEVRVNVPRHPSEGTKVPTGPRVDDEQDDRPGSVPGTAPTKPTTDEPGEPRLREVPVTDPPIPDRLPNINPLFPDSLPAEEPGRDTPPPIPLIHNGDRVDPVRHVTPVGRC